jgi:hypothetical protein
MEKILIKKKELDAKLADSKLQHSQEQQTLENRLQEAMSHSQHLLVENIEKNAEINDLKKKFLKDHVQEKPDLIELEPDVIELDSDSTSENSNHTEQRSVEEEKQDELDSMLERPFDQMRVAERAEMDVTLKRSRIKSLISKLIEPTSAKRTTLESNFSCNKSLKRPHETEVSSDKTIAASRVKKQSIEFIDTKQIAVQVHSVLKKWKISYETFAVTHEMKREKLAELLDYPKPWHLLNEEKRKQYLYLNSWATHLKKPNRFDIEVLRLANDVDSSFRTAIISEQTMNLLFQINVSHEFFAEKYLLISKIKFEQLMWEPVEWEQCSYEQREIYRSCYDWAFGGEKAGYRLRGEHLRDFVKDRW